MTTRAGTRPRRCGFIDEGGFSPEVKEKIYSTNALRILRLDEPAPVREPALVS